MSACWVYKKKIHKPTELTVHKTFTLSLSNTVHCLANSPLKTLMVNSHISRLLAILHFMPIIIKGKTSRTGIHLARKGSSNTHFFFRYFWSAFRLRWNTNNFLVFNCISSKEFRSKPILKQFLRYQQKNCCDIFVLKQGNFREHTVHTSPPSTNQSWGVCCFYR